MDVHTKAQRSYNMSRIKSENTKPELVMFKMLEREECEFEKHYPIAGKPDIVFPDCKVAIFIDGEFWHGKDFKLTKRTMSPFWLKKIGDNIKRDRRNTRVLRSEGWHVIHFWGRHVTKNPEKSFRRVINFVDRIRLNQKNRIKPD